MMQIIEGNLALLGDEKIAMISSRFNHLIELAVASAFDNPLILPR